MYRIVGPMRDSSLYEKVAKAPRNSSSGEKIDVEQTSDLDDCVLEIVRALARAAARRDHRQAVEARAIVPSEISRQ